jgi:hypothetical protein
MQHIKYLICLCILALCLSACGQTSPAGPTQSSSLEGVWCATDEEGSIHRVTFYDTGAIRWEITHTQTSWAYGGFHARRGDTLAIEFVVAFEDGLRYSYYRYLEFPIILIGKDQISIGGIVFDRCPADKAEEG